MAVPKRRKQERERDLEIIAGLYLRGYSQVAIAENISTRDDIKYTLSQGTISNDIKEIQKRWRESTLTDFDLAKQKELQQIDLVQKEAWDAWERSKNPTTVATQETEPVTQENGKTLTNRTLRRVMRQTSSDGNARYLEIVLQCGRERRKILGIDENIEISDNRVQTIIFGDKRIEF